ARADEAHLLHAGHPLAEALREAHLAGGRRAVGGALPGRGGDRVDDRGVGVAEDRRAVALHVVDEPHALHVPHVRALATRDEVGGAARRAERPHRLAHPAGDRREGPLVQRRVGHRRLPRRRPVGRAVPDAHWSTSARWRAKYVRTMSAPARLIALICSSATASPSIQPRSAAACTIAYSPETW